MQAGLDAFRAFQAALSPAARDALAALTPSLLESRLRSLCDDATAAWPTVRLPAPAFLSFLAAKLDGARSLDQLSHNDLYLTCACAAGDPAALLVLEANQLAFVGGALRRTGASTDQVDEVLQRLRQQLLVSVNGEPAGIAAFAGSGDLRGWLRITATRELVRVAQRGQRETRLETGELAQRLSDDEDDLETRYLKTKYGAIFKAAIAEALEQLDARDRRLLRYQVVDGLTIDEIGVLHRTHRATAARWLVAARTALGDGARERLAAQLQLDEADVESVLRLVDSQLDVSIERILRESD